MECPLCKLADGDVRTYKWFEDKKWMIVDCLSCGRPLIIIKKHKKSLSLSEQIHLLKLVKMVFGYQNIKIASQHLDKTIRSIEEHWHAHVNR